MPPPPPPPPPSLLTYVPSTTQVAVVDSYLKDRDSILRDLRHNLHQAQDHMKSHADQHRRDVTFSVGDWVYLKLQPYRQSSVAFRASLKLSPRFYCPYQILARFGTVAYRLDLPAGSCIHNVFHVSLLRKHLGVTPIASPDLPPTSDDSTVMPQPEAVLDRRIIHKGKYRSKTEVLIKWKGAPIEDAT